MNKYEKVLQNMERLKVLRDLALLDSPEEPFFDKLTKLASRVIGVPVSLVSMVASDYQFFKSSEGLPEPWKSDRRTPLSHSFCQHVVTSGDPLIVSDAREHDLLKTNKAIPDLDVIGYLGMPLKTSSGQSLGSFCVIDSEPHEWTADEIEIVGEFAKLVNLEIDARVQAKANDTLNEHIEQMSVYLVEMTNNIDANTPKADVIAQVKRLQGQVASLTV